MKVAYKWRLTNEKYVYITNETYTKDLPDYSLAFISSGETPEIEDLIKTAVSTMSEFEYENCFNNMLEVLNNDEDGKKINLLSWQYYYNLSKDTCTDPLCKRNPIIVVDDFLSTTSINPVQNRVITKALNEKQDLLISGVNLKTINGETLLGEGDITIKNLEEKDNVKIFLLNLEASTGSSAGFVVNDMLNTLVLKESSVLIEDALTGKIYSIIEYKIDGKLIDFKIIYSEEYIKHIQLHSGTDLILVNENILFNNISASTETIKVEDLLVYTLDLSNENAGINCDKDGNILPNAYKPTCKATLYLGTDEATGATYQLLYNEALNVSGVSIDIMTGEITFEDNFTFDNTIPSMELIVIARHNLNSLMKVMTINKQYPGIDGKAAVTKWIVPSANSIILNVNTNEPTPSSITATVMSQTNDEEPKVDDETVIYYGWDTETPEIQFIQGENIIIDTTKKYLSLALKTNNETNGTIYEIETIPVISEGKNGKDGADGKDGTDGKNAEMAYVLDLTNELAAVNCDSGGNILEKAVKPTCKATLYYGIYEVNDAKYSIYYPNNVSGLSINEDTGEITFSETEFAFDNASIEIVVRASIDNVQISKVMTVVKQYPGADGTGATIRWIVPSHNAIMYDPNTKEISPSSITATVMSQTNENPIATDRDTKIYYGWDTENPQMLYEGAINSNKDAKLLSLCLRKENKENGDIYEIETIPVLSKGINGEGAYVLDLTNETASVICDSNGDILDESMMPSCEAVLYQGLNIVDAKYQLSIPESANAEGISITEEGVLEFEKTVSFDTDYLEITVMASPDNGTTWYKKIMTVTKQYPGADGIAVSKWIVPSHKAVKYNPNDKSLNPTKITAIVMTQTNAEDPTVDNNTPIFYGYDTDNPQTLYEETGITVNIEYSSISIALRTGDESGGTIYEIETIPILKDGTNGESSVFLELWNESAAVNCDADGNIISDLSILTCPMQLYKGSQPMLYNVTYSFDTDKDVPEKTITIDKYGVSKALYFNNTDNDKFSFEGDSLKVTVKASYGGLIYFKEMTIVKQYPGKDGKGATIKWVVPSHNIISYNPNSGSYSPGEIVVKILSQTNDEPIQFCSGDTLYYGWDTENPEGIAVYDGTEDGYVIGVDTSKKYLTIALRNENKSGGTIYEIETIPVLKDGIDSKSAYILDLTNENASINCDADGVILSGAVKPKCKAILYSGSDIVSGATYKIDPSVTGVTGLTIDEETGVLNFGNDFKFNGTSIGIEVIGSPDGETWYKKIMTVSKQYPGKDGEGSISKWIVPSHNIIAYNPNNKELTPSSITVTVMSQTNAEEPVVDTGTTIFYKWGENGTVEEYSGDIVIGEDDINAKILTLSLRKGNTVDGEIYESETIPILKDGTNGENGEDAETAYILDLTNEFAGVNCDSGGTILEDIVLPTCQAILYYGKEVVENAIYKIETSASGVTIDEKGVLTFTNNDFDFSGKSVEINVMASPNNGTTWYKKIMTIIKQYPGADGNGATIKWIVPSHNTISYDPNGSGLLSPEKISFKVLSQTNNNPIEEVTGATIFYGWDTEDPITPLNYNENNYTLYTTGIAPNAKYLTVALRNENKSGGTIYEIETIPVLKDGVNGNNGEKGENGAAACYLDLTNENASINCDAEGVILSGAVLPTCRAIFYVGGSTTTAITGYEVTDVLGNIAKNTIYINNEYQESNFGELTFTSGFTFTGDVAEINVSCGYNYETYTKTMTITKQKPGKDGTNPKIYWIVTDADVIKLDENGNPSVTAITPTVMYQDGNNLPSAVTTNDAIEIRYNFDNEDETTPKNNVIEINSGVTAYSVLNLRLYISGTLVDSETIPILRDGKDGKDGVKGAALRGPIDYNTITETRRFSNGIVSEGNEEDGLFIDIIIKDGKYYYCNTSYNHELNDTWDDVEKKWTESDAQYNFVATNLLLADSALIKFQSSNELYLMDDENKVKAGAKGGGEISFWAGSEDIDAISEAKIIFNSDGSGHLANRRLSWDANGRMKSYYPIQEVWQNVPCDIKTSTNHEIIKCINFNSGAFFNGKISQVLNVDNGLAYIDATYITVPNNEECFKLRGTNSGYKQTYKFYNKSYNEIMDSGTTIDTRGEAIPCVFYSSYPNDNGVYFSRIISGDTMIFNPVTNLNGEALFTLIKDDDGNVLYWELDTNLTVGDDNSKTYDILLFFKDEGISTGSTTSRTDNEISINGTGVKAASAVTSNITVSVTTEYGQIETLTISDGKNSSSYGASSNILWINAITPSRDSTYNYIFSLGGKA